MSFGIVNINDISCEKFNNVSVYDIIRDKLFENNDMLSSIYLLNKRFQFIMVKLYIIICLSEFYF
jgi:hypothetical protein